MKTSLLKLSKALTLRFKLLNASIQSVSKAGQQTVDGPDDTLKGRLDTGEDLGEQHLTRRQVGQGLDAVHVDHAVLKDTGLDDELRFLVLGEEITKLLGSGGFLGVGEGQW